MIAPVTRVAGDSGIMEINCMKLVTIHRSFNPAEADLIRSRLEAAEFQVFVAHAGASLALEGYALTAGGILVQVPEDQAEEAMALLAAE